MSCLRVFGSLPSMLSGFLKGAPVANQEIRRLNGDFARMSAGAHDEYRRDTWKTTEGEIIMLVQNP